MSKCLNDQSVFLRMPSKTLDLMENLFTGDVANITTVVQAVARILHKGTLMVQFLLLLVTVVESVVQLWCKCQWAVEFTNSFSCFIPFWEKSG
jgi:hypothetical protein